MPIPLPQADEPEGQQTAQFRTALGGGHLVGRQGIGAFHGVFPFCQPHRDDAVS